VSAICFPLPELAPFGLALANALGAMRGELEIHRFPDGETRVRLGAECAGKSVILVGGGRHPDRGALPLLFAAHATRAMGAASVGLAAPYLPYMRQDTEFRRGEAVSAQAYARCLSGAFDWVATVDPHLHRIQSLGEIFTIPSYCVTSVPAIAQWIAMNVTDPVIIGPDAESAQWVEGVGRRLAAPWTALSKIRTGDRDVSVSLPDRELLRGRSPVIVDDIASSGRTLAEAAMALRGMGAATVTCVVVHALLADGAESAIHAAGVARLVSTNTIVHASNAIDVAPLLAERIRHHLEAA
jgi:ribose-phosphate pyrophosphokinase